MRSVDSISVLLRLLSNRPFTLILFLFLELMGAGASICCFDSDPFFCPFVRNSYFLFLLGYSRDRCRNYVIEVPVLKGAC